MRLGLIIVILTAIGVCLVQLRSRANQAQRETEDLTRQQSRVRMRIRLREAELGFRTSPAEVERRSAELERLLQQTATPDQVDRAGDEMAYGRQ